MERSLYLATGLEFTQRLLILVRLPRENSPKRPTSMSDSFANGLVPRLLLDTLAMMRQARLFFSLPNKSQLFADPNSPAAMTGGFYAISAIHHDEPLVAESFRTGAGLPWGKHHNCLFCGIERFFRPGYEANINENWIPALDGVQEK